MQRNLAQLQSHIIHVYLIAIIFLTLIIYMLYCMHRRRAWYPPINSGELWHSMIRSLPSARPAAGRVPKMSYPGA